MIKITNPHKNCLIPRGAGYEDAFYPILKKITGCTEGKFSAGADYENEVFSIRTYFMGDTCPCKMCEFKRDFQDDNIHTDDCFQVALKELNKAYKEHPKYTGSTKLKIARLEHEKFLMKEFKVPFSERKHAENICTCEYHKKMQKELGPIGFVEECYHNLPNFHHKETGFKVWIYKNFFRDAFSNIKIDLPKFKGLCQVCLQSLPKQMHEPVKVTGEDIGGQF